MVDGRLGVTLRGERLWIGLAVENITNVDALEFVTEDVFFPGGFGVIQEFQRNYSLAVKYAW
jgi:hypothetical protein